MTVPRHRLGSLPHLPPLLCRDPCFSMLPPSPQQLSKEGKGRERENEPGSQARKGKSIRGKREGDWLLRRINVLPFWWSPPYTPPMKNSLQAWSPSQRSGIWMLYSFEKIGTSEITGCHLGTLISLTDHCDFILHMRGRRNEPSYH